MINKSAVFWMATSIALTALASHQTGKLETLKQAQSLKIAEAYKEGYDAGAGAASVNTSRQCVDWWFGTDFKERHKQAQQAYCKGKR